MNKNRYSLAEALALIADDSINDENLDEFETTETQECISFEDNFESQSDLQISTQSRISNTESRIDEHVNSTLAVDRFATETEMESSIQPNLDDFGSIETDNMVRVYVYEAEQDELHKTHDGFLTEFESNELASNLPMFTRETIVMTDNGQTYFDLSNQENKPSRSSVGSKSHHEIQTSESDKTVIQTKTSEEGAYENNYATNTNFIRTEEIVDAVNKENKSTGPNDNNGEVRENFRELNSCTNVGDQVANHDIEENPDAQSKSISANDNVEEVGENSIYSNSDINLDDPVPNRGRKRRRDTSIWKMNMRKTKRQAGEEYRNSKGNVTRKRELKSTKDCMGKCRYKCSHVFSEQDRKKIFTKFWSLDDNEKQVFYSQTTERSYKAMRRDQNNNKTDSRRKYTYKYFFKSDGEKYQICKEFYLTTLDISHRRIQWFHEKSTDSSSKFCDMRGKKTKRRIPNERLDVIRRHILSFNRMPSHYCRASTSKEYLEPGLSLCKMYEMYCVKCEEINIIPEKICTYRKVFNTEFNIGFHVPKKDLCDLCEEYKSANRNSPDIENQTLKLKFEAHQTDKASTKCERDTDRKGDQMVVCFDMQNVIALPRANTSNFFYKRKLNVYNLTAHCSEDNTAYNAIWCEGLAGRGANEIASALTTILAAIKRDHPSVTSFILWSDSCVPQNRNSTMCFALKRFMVDNPTIVQITQKFSTPGHSAIQEVDGIHSHIEKTLKISEIYSPVGLIRVLKSVRRKHMKIIQLHKYNFFDYQKSILGLRFHQIPFTKVKCLKFRRELPFHVDLKLSFTEDQFKQVRICKMATRSGNTFLNLPRSYPMVKEPVISAEKRRDIASMFKYMPQVDLMYYKTILRMDIPKSEAGGLLSKKT